MPQRRMAWLDALRAIAALLVVYAHLSHYLLRGARSFSAEWVHAGPAGVMLFFLVSGYIVPASLERHGDLRRFWIGRAARLYPLYLVVGVVAVLLAAITAGGLGGGGAVDGAIGHLTMLPQLLGVPLATPVFWTLSFEMAFYLLVSALFALGWHRRSALMAVTFATSGVVVAPLSPGLLARPVLPAAAVLALGLATLISRHRTAAVCGAALLLALTTTLLAANQDVSHVWDGLLIPAVMFTGTTIYRSTIGQIPKWHAAATAAVVAIALLTNWFAELASLGALTPHYMTRSILTLLVIGGAFALGLAWRDRRVPRFLSWLGTISYSVYLIHVLLIAMLAPVLTLLGERLHGPVELLAVAAFLAVLLGLSGLSHRFIELPGQRLGHRLTDAHSGLVPSHG